VKEIVLIPMRQTIHFVLLVFPLLVLSCTSPTPSSNVRMVCHPATIVANDAVKPSIALYSCSISNESQVAVKPLVVAYVDGRVLIHSEDAPDDWVIISYIDPRIVERSRDAVMRRISGGTDNFEGVAAQWQELSVIAAGHRQWLRCEAAGAASADAPFRETWADCISMMLPLLEAISSMHGRSEEMHFRRVQF
jgi:hypothetical protein